MFNFGNKEFRNLQEQVGKNQEDIATLKTGIKFEYWVASVSDLVPLTIEENVGKWIAVGSGSETRAYTISKRVGGGLIATSFGKYPAEGPQGQKGETGDTGATGRNPKLVVGYWPLPQDDSYQYRDVFILRADAGVYHKGDLFQKDNYGNWQLMFNLVGPQGVPASEGDEVIANPEGVSAVEQLNTVLIDGVCYGVYGLSAEEKAFVTSLKEVIAIDAEGSVEFGHDVYADGNLQAGNDVEVGRKLILRGTGTKADIVDENGDPVDFGSTPANMVTTDTAQTITGIKTIPATGGFVDSNGDDLIKSDTSTAFTVGNNNNNTDIKGDDINLIPANGKQAKYGGYEIANKNDISVQLGNIETLLGDI